MSFNTLSRKLVDTWISTKPDGSAAPQELYKDVSSRLSMKMRLLVVHTEAANSKEWVIETIRPMSILSRFLNLNSFFKDGRLGDLRDQSYVESVVLPAYERAIVSRQPVIDTVETKVAGVRLVYDRVILPQKNVLKPEWLVVCSNGRFMAGAPDGQIQFDATDEAIVGALISGQSIKEIASAIHLSPRTVEHRLERIKKQVGAKNLHHLTALVVTAGFDRSIRYTSDSEA